MTKLIVAFRNYVNASKNRFSVITLPDENIPFSIVAAMYDRLGDVTLLYFSNAH